MAFTVPDEGRLADLNWLRGSGLASAKVILYENDPTLAETTVYADLTQPSWAGYAAQPTSGWTVPALTGDGHAVTSCDPVQWIKTDAGSSNVYGYAIVDSNNKILGVERFAAAPVPIAQLVPFPMAVSYKDTTES